MRTSQPGEEKDALRGETLGEKPRMDRSLVAPVHEICLAPLPASQRPDRRTSTKPSGAALKSQKMSRLGIKFRVWRRDNLFPSAASQKTRRRSTGG
jgi:hypothetical protein